MSSVIILAERTDLTVKRSREVDSRVPDTFTPRGGSFARGKILSSIDLWGYVPLQRGDTGAFLVPYSIMLVVGGIPLFYMELALGQFNRKGAITCWGRLVPLFKGIGYAVALIAFYVDFYYNVIIAWALRYFFASFTNHLPWTTCDNSWNTPHCKEVGVHQPPATTLGTPSTVTRCSSTNCNHSQNTQHCNEVGDHQPPATTLGTPSTVTRCSPTTCDNSWNTLHCKEVGVPPTTCDNSRNTPHCNEVGVHQPPATTLGTRHTVKRCSPTTCDNSWNTLHCKEVGVPPTTCDNSRNTQHCNKLRIIAWDTEDAERDNSSVIIEPYTMDATATATSYHHDAANLSDTPFNSSKYTSAASEYFNRAILELNQSSGLHDLGAVKWDIALCLLAVYIICYFSLWKGISTSGKVVWFTALFPYAVLLILLVRGVTLPGSAEGIRYYLSPNFDAITKAEHHAASRYVNAETRTGNTEFPFLVNKFRWDALVTSVINSCTSFIAGFVIFSVLGYMAHASGRHIKDVATEGPGLVFIVYPAAIATMPGSIFWALIFFMMLLTLGLDSSFGGSEAIITALSDEFPIIGHNREIFVACLFTLYFLVGLASCSQGGFYFFHLLDRYAAGYSMLFAVLFETIAVSWIYGTQRFCDDIHDMIGFSPGIYWRVCWKFLAPAFLMFIIVYGLVGYEPLTYDEYVYPLWANLLGWFIAGSSVAMIPGMAIFKMATTPGTFMQRLKFLTTPWRDQQMAAMNGVQTDSTQVKLTSSPVAESV
uniref:Uncharacterized protein n=1 Tax=Timema bartmani TaxID=61472 RepID=A0A7R9F4B7_9NEOP|nr:unnamed protein product [Timema bartmani]